MVATKNSCPEKATLAEFLSGRLPESHIQFVEDHLRSCSPCGNTIRTLDKDHTSTDLVEQVVGQLNSNFATLESAEQFHVESIIDQLQARQPGVAGTQVKNDDVKGERPGNTVDSDEITKASRASEVVSRLADSKHATHLGRLAHYEVTRLLGSGGTGVVFKAIDTKLQRAVALKVLRPSLGKMARDRFISEARTAARINHDQVVTIYHVDESDGLAYMAMQWLPGETLEDLLRREPTPCNDVVEDLFRQIALGLAAAHESGLIHRDIKPANVWIEQEHGRVKILDFGLARVADDDPQFTETGMIAGTPGFMSPEQARGASIDQRSDLFSLGCVLYRMLAGQLPFQAPNVLATLQSIQRFNPPHPIELNSGAAPGLNDLAMSLLEKNADQRPQSAVSILHALELTQSQWKFKVPKKVRSKDSQTALLKANPKPEERSIRRWLLAILLLMLFTGGLMFGPQIIRIATGKGIVEIRTNDPNVDIEVMQNGNSIKIIDGETNQAIEIKEGIYQLRAVGDQNEVSITPEQLTMTRGGKEIVQVKVSALLPKDSSLPKDALLPESSGLPSPIQNRSDQRADAPESQYRPDDRDPSVSTLQQESDVAEIQLLTEVILKLELELADLVSRYSDNHPKVVQAKSIIIDLKSRLTQFAPDGFGIPDLRPQASEQSNDHSSNQPIDSAFSPEPEIPPTYDGKSFEYWLNMAATERKPELAAEVVEALNALTDRTSAMQAFPYVIALIRNVNFHGEGREHLTQLLQKMPPKRLRRTIFEILNDHETEDPATSFAIISIARQQDILMDSVGSPEFLDELLDIVDSADTSQPENIAWSREYLTRCYELTQHGADAASQRSRIVEMLQNRLKRNLDGDLIDLASILSEEAPESDELAQQLGDSLLDPAMTLVERENAVHFLKDMGKHANPAIPAIAAFLKQRLLDSDPTAMSHLNSLDKNALSILYWRHTDAKPALETLKAIHVSLKDKPMFFELNSLLGETIAATEKSMKTSGHESASDGGGGGNSAGKKSGGGTGRRNQ